MERNDVEWISVNTKLPLLFEDALVVAISENGETYEEGKKYMTVDHVVDWMDGHKTCFRTDRVGGKVTHWVYLPKMPKD